MNPLCTLKFSEDAISLADALTATVSIDGLSPIAVTPPTPFLSESSRLSWQIKPSGPASVAKLLDGQERWTQTYRLEPFVPGDAVKVEFGPFLVAHGAAAPVAVQLPAHSVAVKSSLAVGANDLRAITGPETLPPLPAAEQTLMVPAIGIVAAILVIVIAIVLRRRIARQLPPPALDAQQAFAAIAAEPDPQQFAHRLSVFLRERRQLTKQTTAEIAIQFPDSPLLPILNRCDAVRFAGESLNIEEQAALIAAARPLVEPPQ